METALINGRETRSCKSDLMELIDNDVKIFKSAEDSPPILIQSTQYQENTTEFQSKAFRPAHDGGGAVEEGEG